MSWSYAKSLTPLHQKVMPIPFSGCWVWLGSINRKGYGRLNIKGQERFVHRASWQQHHGQIPDGMSVCHKCDVPACVNPDHLFLGTNQNNNMDKVSKDRQSAKLTKAQVGAIRNSKEKLRVLAALYGVSISNISMIQNYYSWRHLGESK